MTMRLLRRTAFVVAATAALLTPSLVPGTTVEPVTFDMLVRDADRIIVGTVAGVESFRADLDGNLRIRTRVIFGVGEALRGRGALMVLEFLGGTVGDVTLTVAGMPHFAIGERYVVFAREGDRWVNPVVGFTQGLLRVSRDARTGTSLVLTSGGAPLTDVASIGRPRSAVSTRISIPMSLTSFLDTVRMEIARQAQ